MKGFVANRLQAALWREAFYLVDQCVALVADIDKAIAHGPGLRWALLGPFLNLHLSGGDAGIKHVLEQLGPPRESWWRDLADTSITPKVVEKFVERVNAELKPFDLSLMTDQREDVPLSLLEFKGQEQPIALGWC